MAENEPSLMQLAMNISPFVARMHDMYLAVPSSTVHLGRVGCLLINACHFGLLSSDKGGWRTCVAWLHAFFVLYVAMVLPVTGQHLTLYLNVLLVVQMMRASLSPKTGAWLWHSATFISAHTLLFNHIHQLYVVGNGSVAAGFDTVDRVQWTGGNATHYPDVHGASVAHLRTIEMAYESSFVLHCLPILIVHRDLSAHRASLAVAYSKGMYGGGRGLTTRSRMATHAWNCFSAFLVPLAYQLYLLAVFDSTEEGLELLYRVPREACAGLVKGGLAMNVALAVVAYLYLTRYLQPSAALAATASTDKKKK
jgi:hypothetical protein